MPEAPTQPETQTRSLPETQTRSLPETQTRSLRAAAHPQARMQQLLSERQPPESRTEENTEKNTPSHTDLLTGPLTAEDTETTEEAPAQTKPRPGTPTQAPRRKGVRGGARPAASQSGPTASAHSRIVEDLQKEPVVRKTIDIPASLNERLQDYCAANRIKTERRVFLVLLESFLEGEGF